MSVTPDDDLDTHLSVAAVYEAASKLERRPSQVHRRSAWRSRLTRFDMKFAPYLFIAPFFILFFAFGLIPLVANAVVALRHYQLDDPTGNAWIGLDNFRAVLHDSDFKNSLEVTFGIFIICTSTQLPSALILAAVLNRKLRGKTLWRMGVLIPNATPVAATALIFSSLFAQDIGVVNSVLTFIQQHASWTHIGPTDWKLHRWSSWIAITAMVNWRWIGYNALIYLAAMQSVPKDLYEAASIDGASYWRQFRSITIPLIRPALIFTVVLATIGQLQLFTEPLLFDDNALMAQGGAAHAFQTASVYIYKKAWVDLNLGYSAALSWVLFLIIIVFASLNAVLTNRIGGRK